MSIGACPAMALICSGVISMGIDSAGPGAVGGVAFAGCAPGIFCISTGVMFMGAAALCWALTAKLESNASTPIKAPGT